MLDGKTIELFVFKTHALLQISLHTTVRTSARFFHTARQSNKKSSKESWINLQAGTY